jgi:hypothetical protein
MATVTTTTVQVPQTVVTLTLSEAEAGRVATRLIAPTPAIKGDDGQDIGQQINQALA